MILYIGNKLSKHGFTPTGVEYLGDLLESGGFEMAYASDKLNSVLRLLDMLWSVVKHSRAKIILIDTYSSKAFNFAWLAGNLAFFLNIPFILILRGGDLLTRVKTDSSRTKALFTKAARVVSVSQFLQQGLKDFHTTQYIPNSIDISKYAFKAKTKIEPKLLWVRSFHKVYNPDLAVQVSSLISKLYPNFELAMVGPDKDGSLGRVESLIESLELSGRIKIVGRLSKSDWIKLSEEYDIFINTTNHDNMPISVTEAMALGLPVVSTNVGGMPFLINNESEGLLVPPRDTKSFASAIVRLIENQGFAAGLAKMARKKVEHFDNSIALKQWKDLIHEVIQQHS